MDLCGFPPGGGYTCDPRGQNLEWSFDVNGEYQGLTIQEIIKQVSNMAYCLKKEI